LDLVIRLSRKREIEMKDRSLPYLGISYMLALGLASFPCISLFSQQKTDMAPLVVPTGAVGWGREYHEIASESFTTKIRVAAPGFVLEQYGQFASIEGEPWIIGSSDGTREYAGYYRTDPAALPLAAGREYAAQVLA
jgi:hypothetical protein